jgi:alginate production protein
LQVSARDGWTGAWRRRGFQVVLSAAIALAVQGAAALARGEESLLDAFEFGGHIEIAKAHQRNFDLDRSKDDDVALVPVELQLELLFDPSDHFEAYVQTTLTNPFVLSEQGENEDRNTELTIEEAYVVLMQPDWGLSLQVGRQLFEDERQWLYDAGLDGLRGAYWRPDFCLELSASREAQVAQDFLNSVDQESVNTYVLYGAYELAQDLTLGAYGILSDYRSGDRDRQLFLGLQSFGTLGERLTYWLDAAHVRGDEESRDLRGYGLDLLATYRFDAPLSPHLILGYAFGSGDSDPEDDTDGAFRQTGLQGNETEVGGLTSFRYYGEAFDPELSNMSIFTAGIGARARAGISLDLVYHYYLQDEASDELRDAGIDPEPTGRSRRLGSEIDLVLGFEQIEDLRVSGFFGHFMPGRAFEPGADDALFLRIEVEYEF